MAKELEITKEYSSGMVDRSGNDCITEKVLDITEDCPCRKRKNSYIFLYSSSERGRIIQIRRLEKTVSSYSAIDFFIEELDFEMNSAPKDDPFGSVADELGLDKTALRKLIEMHAPLA